MSTLVKPPANREAGYYMTLSKKECIEIERYAYELRLEHDVDAQFPVPVELLANKLGYRAGAFSPSENTQRVAGVVDHRDRRIYVNNNDPNVRRRFTIAHEIGHIVYDADSESTHVDYRGNQWPSDPKEQRADYFAASLLMPRDIFKLKYQELDQDIIALAGFFGVSQKAAEIRRITLIEDYCT